MENGKDLTGVCGRRAEGTDRASRASDPGGSEFGVDSCGCIRVSGGGGVDRRNSIDWQYLGPKSTILDLEGLRVWPDGVEGLSTIIQNATSTSLVVTSRRSSSIQVPYEAFHPLLG